MKFYQYIYIAIMILFITSIRTKYALNIGFIAFRNFLFKTIKNFCRSKTLIYDRITLPFAHRAETPTKDLEEQKYL